MINAGSNIGQGEENITRIKGGVENVSFASIDLVRSAVVVDDAVYGVSIRVARSGPVSL